MTEVELIEQTAVRVGMKSLMNHGAASCVYSEGCNGVSQEHLIAFAREVALHCVTALALPHGQEVAAIDADEAFEDLYKRDRRDPSSYDDLAIWRAAWVAGQRALPAGEQEKATEGAWKCSVSCFYFGTGKTCAVCHPPSSQTAPPHGWTAEEEAEFRAKSARIFEREQAAKGDGT